MKTRILLTAVLGAAISLSAKELTESTFTEIIKDVSVVPQATKTAQTAQLKAVVKAPDLVRTGPDSRAELTAADDTITRIGANTVFSFEPAGRNMDLQKGSVLFHSPAGKGGGTIRSGGASAAVLGTTIIVAAVENGGFKVVVLEHRAKVTLPGGKSVTLKEGQLVFVLPGETDFGPVLDINLGKLVGGSLLVNGFSHPLPSEENIHKAVGKQDYEISKGRARDTGQPADSAVASSNGSAKRRSLGKGMNTVDNGTYQAGMVPTITPLQAVEFSQGVVPPGVTQPGGRGIVVIRR